VGDWVAESIGRARVFERLGVDYCCGGKQTLSAACAEKGLSPDEVLAMLHEVPKAADEPDWSTLPLGAVMDDILATHHEHLRHELPRLHRLVRKVASVHGERHPELVRVQAVFGGLVEELNTHMFKEEQILFPLIRQLEAADRRPRFHCGSVENPIAVMEFEHDNAGEALHNIRELTGDYQPPEDACNTYRAMLAGLEGLEENMHHHIHKENNILFPRSIALEASLPV
jgi:regulator of cell morphogenesis and NO signaling